MQLPGYTAGVTYTPRDFMASHSWKVEMPAGILMDGTNGNDGANTTYTYDIREGWLVGKITATGKCVPCKRTRANGAGVATATLVVDNAAAFKAGDSIVIGSNSAVTISSISGNTITIASAKSWSDNDAVATANGAETAIGILGSWVHLRNEDNTAAADKPANLVVGGLVQSAKLLGDWDAIFSDASSVKNLKLIALDTASPLASGTFDSLSVTGDVAVGSLTGADSVLSVTGVAGSSSAGGAVPIAGGAGDGASNAGGAVSLTGGTGGAAGAGGAASVVGGIPVSGNAAGGAGTFSGGAGSGTGAGGAVTTKGGASGAGATGNGGAWTAGGGAALSTAGNGGAVNLSGGVATTTGTGGAVTIIGGASAGASGTAGSVVIDPGAAAGGTAGKVTVCATNGTLEVGGATEAAAIKAIKVSGTIAVAVPTIADAETDQVAVSTAGMTFAAAVGDAVIAIPLEALPTSCILNGAWVSATDEVTVSFGTLEGGAGVTGANKNFKFLFVDLT